MAWYARLIDGARDFINLPLMPQAEFSSLSETEQKISSLLG